MSISLLSIDLGSGSGRGIVVRYDENKRISLHEVYRFVNKVLQKEEHICWDIDYIFSNIKECIKKAFEFDSSISSVGIDNWGCDYAWLDKDGNILQNPRSYREGIDKQIIDKVHSIIDINALYQINGNAYFNFNSVYQLYKDIHVDRVLEKGGDKFLFMPNLFFYLLTGKKICEYTVASTSALMNVCDRDWSEEIFEKLGFLKDIRLDIEMPGVSKCSLKKEIIDELGINADNFLVTSVASHDTASAVIGLGIGHGQAYLLNGTWTLFGLELEEPVIGKALVNKSLVNEGSFGGRIRYMKMFLGTWLFRAIKENYEKLGKNYSYDDIENFAKNSSEEGFVYVDEAFIYPSSMIELFQSRYKEKYGKDIVSIEDISRLAYNSLGNLYKTAVGELEATSNVKIDKIILGGGGVKDELLFEIIKSSTNKEIDIGTGEASVLGNAVVQLYALGYIDDISSVSNIDIEYN